MIRCLLLSFWFNRVEKKIVFTAGVWLRFLHWYTKWFRFGDTVNVCALIAAISSQRQTKLMMWEFWNEWEKKNISQYLFAGCNSTSIAAACRLQWSSTINYQSFHVFFVTKTTYKFGIEPVSEKRVYHYSIYSCVQCCWHAAIFTRYKCLVSLIISTTTLTDCIG